MVLQSESEAREAHYYAQRHAEPDGEGFDDPSDVDVRPIYSQLDQVDEAQRKMAMVIAELENRLAPVLSPDTGPMSGVELAADGVRRELSPVGERLEVLNAVQHSQVGVLRRLIDRLEV